MTEVLIFITSFILTTLLIRKLRLMRRQRQWQEAEAHFWANRFKYLNDVDEAENEKRRRDLNQRANDLSAELLNQYLTFEKLNDIKLLKDSDTNWEALTKKFGIHKEYLAAKEEEKKWDQPMKELNGDDLPPK